MSIQEVTKKYPGYVLAAIISLVAFFGNPIYNEVVKASFSEDQIKDEMLEKLYEKVTEIELMMRLDKQRIEFESGARERRITTLEQEMEELKLKYESIHKTTIK